jgi:hypothetical protein
VAIDVRPGDVTDEVAMVEARVEQLLGEHPPDTTPPGEFWGAQFDLGLAWIQFPEGKGGLGVDPGFQDDVDDPLLRAGAASNLLVNMMGVGKAGPTLVALGTE